MKADSSMVQVHRFEPESYSSERPLTGNGFIVHKKSKQDSRKHIVRHKNLIIPRRKLVHETWSNTGGAIVMALRGRKTYSNHTD